jgi:predicted SnoaL-like aldol condensation-catalyzing enzyme
MPMLSVRLSLAAILLAGAQLAAMPASAQMQPLSDPVTPHPDPESLFTSDDPALHRNKQAALRIMRELLQCNQWERAGEWLTDAYIQHNPLAASGLAGVQNYFINVAGRRPTPTCDKLTSPVVSVQAEGDDVTVLAVRTLPIPGDPEGDTYTTTWFDNAARLHPARCDRCRQGDARGAGPRGDREADVGLCPRDRQLEPRCLRRRVHRRRHLHGHHRA